jgi:tRNA dimethylallyltransferase
MVGYKEFSGLDLDQGDPSSDPQFGDMLERMKLSTYQYARSQIKWIKKQLLPAVKEARSLGGDVQVYVVKGGEEGYAPSIELLQRKSGSKELADE